MNDTQDTNQQNNALKVAVLQFDSGTNKSKNIETALRLSQDAIDKGAEFIVLPEVFNFRSTSMEMKTSAESIPGPSLLPLMALAKESSVSILAGSIIEKSGEGECFNSSAFISSEGKIDAVYRKLHLFDVSVGDQTILESRTFSKGKTPIVASVNGQSIGLSICYDLRFPELYRIYAKEGVSIIVVPSSFTYPTGDAHWELLLRARAIENQCFVLAPNQTGVGAGNIQTYGNSMVIDPYGKVLSRASDIGESVLIETLDFDYQDRLRTQFPCLSHMTL